LAWWQWTSTVKAGAGVAKAMRRSSKTLALASAITALCYLAYLYGDLRFRYALPNNGANFDIPHWNLRLAGYGSAGVGFLIAAVGFWIGSTATHQPDSLTPEPELAPATS
jgi:hypothetical protein